MRIGQKLCFFLQTANFLMWDLFYYPDFMHVNIKEGGSKEYRSTGSPRTTRFLGETNDRVMRNRVMRVLFLYLSMRLGESFF